MEVSSLVLAWALITQTSAAAPATDRLESPPRQANPAAIAAPTSPNGSTAISPAQPPHSRTDDRYGGQFPDGGPAPPATTTPPAATMTAPNASANSRNDRDAAHNVFGPPTAIPSSIDPGAQMEPVASPPGGGFSLPPVEAELPGQRPGGQQPVEQPAAESSSDGNHHAVPGDRYAAPPAAAAVVAPNDSSLLPEADSLSPKANVPNNAAPDNTPSHNASATERGPLVPIQRDPATVSKDRPSENRPSENRPLAQTRLTPPEMVAEALSPPPGSRITGRPLSLATALASTPDRQRRFEVIEAYWQLAELLAMYHFAFDYQAQIQAIDTQGLQATALETARAAADAMVGEAEVRTRTAQHELAALIFLPTDDASLPIPTDRPHVGPYRTQFATLFANRAAPSNAIRIDRTLPLLRVAVDRRAEAVLTANEAWQAALAANSQGQLDVVALQDYARRHLLQQQAMIATIIRYNRDIADYALTVAGPNARAEDLVRMMIKPTDTPIRPLASEMPLAPVANPMTGSQGVTGSMAMPATHLVPVPTPARRPGVPTPARRPQQLQPTPARRPDSMVPTPARRPEAAAPSAKLPSTAPELLNPQTPTQAQPLGEGRPTPAQRPLPKKQVPTRAVRPSGAMSNVQEGNMPVDDGWSASPEVMPEQPQLLPTSDSVLPNQTSTSLGRSTPLARHSATAQPRQVNRQPIELTAGTETGTVADTATIDPSAPNAATPSDNAAGASYAAMLELDANARPRQLAATLHWDRALTSDMGETINLLDCLRARTGGDRRELLHSYWYARQLTAQYQVLVDQQQQLDSFASSLETGAQLPGVLRVKAAQAQTQATQQEIRASLVEAQYDLAARTGRLDDLVWPLPSTPPHAGRYDLRLDAQAAQLLQTWPMRRLVSAIPGLARCLQQYATVVIETDAQRAATMNAVRTTEDSIDRVIGAIGQQTDAAMAFLELLTEYNQAIADYVLAVAPANTADETLVATLVLKP